MKGIKILLNALISLLVNGLCWIPFYTVGPKTILTAILTMVVGFLLSTIIYQYVAKKLDKRLEEIKNDSYWDGMLAVRGVVEKRNPRWSRLDAPIWDEDGNEMGSQTNYGAMDSAIRREFEERNK
jgi:hypothetical protein